MGQKPENEDGAEEAHTSPESGVLLEPWYDKEKGGVLVPEVHGRLVSDLSHIVEQAGLGEAHKHYVWESLHGVVGAAEIKYVQEFHNLPVFGAVYIGGDYNSVYDKMLALTGAFIRNFVDARIMTTEAIVTANKQGMEVNPTVLLIPNLYVSEKTVDWKTAIVADICNQRILQGRHTVVYVSNKAEATVIFGKSMMALMEKKLAGFKV